MSEIRTQNPEPGYNQDDDYFIKETIKKKPINAAFYARRAALLAASGVILGSVAATSFVIALPTAAELFMKKEDVSLEDAKPGPVGTGNLEEETAEMEAMLSEEYFSSLNSDTGSDYELSEGMEIYASVQQDAIRIAAKPMKAMVRISGLSSDSDLLDDSFLTYGDEEGVVFLNNQSDLYILTSYKGLEKAETIRVTFSNGSVANGILCKADVRTGIAVVRVPLDLLTDEDLSKIYVAPLSNSSDEESEKSVIAIGSPSGNYGAIVYGMITSVSGRMNAADCEYTLLGTNIMGSTESSGVLLDMDGNVTGLIVRTQEDENILKAVSVTQLRPLIEILSNGETIRYLGIRGLGISVEQAVNLGIPEGIYVNSLESGSPAMVAGIQSGDIITGLDGMELKDMKTYMTVLQNQEVGGKVEMTVKRKAPDGEFAEMKFTLTVEEK